ncbi:MAG: hypothetical protein M8841_08950 [marine benthic group bacterium]|jgi:hypothetical protein|nr:hypothetical protein [Gemmatimonadota bacterium]MCL7991566.1 hypothetical protein [Gemmatimonadota bacterium]
MRRFRLLMVLGFALTMFGAAGSSFDVNSDRFRVTDESGQSEASAGVAATLLDFGFERTVEVQTSQRPLPGMTYEVGRVRG